MEPNEFWFLARPSNMEMEVRQIRKKEILFLEEAKSDWGMNEQSIMNSFHTRVHTKKNPSKDWKGKGINSHVSLCLEYLCERFPYMKLDEDGPNWKECVYAINGAIRKTRHTLKKCHKQAREATLMMAWLQTTASSLWDLWSCFYFFLFLARTTCIKNTRPCYFNLFANRNRSNLNRK